MAVLAPDVPEPDAWWLPAALQTFRPAGPDAKAPCTRDAVRSAEQSCVAAVVLEQPGPPAWLPWSGLAAPPLEAAGRLRLALQCSPQRAVPPPAELAVGARLVSWAPPELRLAAERAPPEP